MTPTDHVMALLAAGVPLSLLCDLAEPRGPESAAILLDETADPDVIHGGCIDLTAARRRRAATA